MSVVVPGHLTRDRISFSKKIQKVNSRLDDVEHGMQKEGHMKKNRDIPKLSIPDSKHFVKGKKSKVVTSNLSSDSSSYDDALPCLSVFR